MESNPYFPLFFSLTGKKIAVIGAGTIAARRIKALLGFGAEITVIAPEISEEIKELSENPQNHITLKCRPYASEDSEGMFWLIAAANQREVNHKAGLDARKAGALVTVSDAKEESTVYFPGIARQEHIVVGVTASGKDHLAAKKITEKCRKVLEK